MTHTPLTDVIAFLKQEGRDPELVDAFKYLARVRCGYPVISYAMYLNGATDGRFLLTGESEQAGRANGEYIASHIFTDENKCENAGKVIWIANNNLVEMPREEL